MLSYTSEYETAIRSVTRELKGYLQFNGDSTKQISGESGLVSFKVHHTAMNEERFCIGSTCSAYCEATFFNSGLPSGVSLANSYFDAYIGVVLADSSVEYKPMGRFYINEISRGKETTAIVGYDVTCKLDKDYTPTVTRTSNGYLVMDILNDIIDQTGVNGGQHFTNVGNDVYVTEIYEGTCREQWGWLMLICSALGVNSVGSRVDLGWIEERSFSDGDLPYLRYSAVDDSLIYLDGIDLGDLFTVNSITTGTDDSPIVVGNGVGINSPNPYINQTQAEAIYSTLHGASFTPMRLHFRGDPCIEVMDSFKVVQGDETYRCVAMAIETTFNGGLEQTIECWGDSEEYYAMSSGRMNTIESKVSTNSTLLQEMAQSIETARGGVITQVLDTDGTWKELVIANSQDLSQATSVWRFNIAGLAHSTSYTGGTYSFALDDQGRIIANLIQTGKIQDASGKNSWDLDTGEFVTKKGRIGRYEITDTYIETFRTEGDPTTCTGMGGAMAFWAGDSSSASAPFRVTYAGKLYATGAAITDGSISATYTKTYNHSNYNSSDLTTIQNIVTSGTTPTAAQLEKYDIDGSGTITNADLVKVRNMINNAQDIVKTVTTVINPASAGQAIKTTTAFTGAYSNTFTAVLDGSKLDVNYVNAAESVTGNGGHFQYLYPLNSSNYVHDFVIEEGYASPWYWRKWNSGYAEAWARVAHTLSFSTSWGAVYTADINPESYPFSFRDGTQPIEQVSAVGAKSGTDNSCWICNYGGRTGPTHLQTGKYQAIRPVSGSATIRIAYYVRGLL